MNTALLLDEGDEEARNNRLLVRAAIPLIQSLWLCAKESEDSARKLVASITQREFELLVVAVENVVTEFPDLADLYTIPSEWLENRDRAERFAERVRETTPVNDA